MATEERLRAEIVDPDLADIFEVCDKVGITGAQKEQLLAAIKAKREQREQSEIEARERAIQEVRQRHADIPEQTFREHQTSLIQTATDCAAMYMRGDSHKAFLRLKDVIEYTADDTPLNSALRDLRDTTGVQYRTLLASRMQTQGVAATNMAGEIQLDDVFGTLGRTGLNQAVVACMDFGPKTMIYNMYALVGGLHNPPIDQPPPGL